MTALTPEQREALLAHGAPPGRETPWRYNALPFLAAWEPVIAEWLADLTRERDEAQAAVARVEALHQQSTMYHRCEVDGLPWPCLTIRALRGEP